MAGHGHDVQTSIEVFAVDHHANVRVCVNPHQLPENNMIPQPEQPENAPVPSLTSGETNVATVNVSETRSAGMGLQQSPAHISNEIDVVSNPENILERGDEQDMELGDSETTRGSRKRKTTEQELGQSSESETQFVQSSRTVVPVSTDDSSFIIMFDSSNVSDDTLEEEHRNQRMRIEAENLPFADYVARDSENEMVNSTIGIHNADQGDESAIAASDQALDAPPMDLDAANTNPNGRSRLSVASFLPESISASILPEAFAASIEDLINSIPAEDVQAASSEIAFFVNQVVPQSGRSPEDATGNNTENLIEGSPNEGLTDESGIIPSNRTGIAETGVAIGSRQSTSSHLNPHQVRLLKLIHRYLSPYVLAQQGRTPSSTQSEAPGSFDSFFNQSQMNQIERDHRSGGHSHDLQPFYGLTSFLDRDSDDDEESDFPPLIQTSWQGRARGAYGISELQFLFGQDYVRRRGSYRYEGSRFYDRHRDMRLDVDNMSYEELLALEERIGVVSTGLNEQEKSKCMKLWTYACGPSPKKEEPEPCCICQEEFVDGAEMGSLICEHNFHAECIKKWLDDKKICPYCRESAVDEKSLP